MHGNDKKQQFIELRAKGISYSKISSELGVAKSTLVDWSYELRQDIANLQQIEREALLEEYSLAAEYRLRNTATLLKRIREEISHRDLSEVPTAKLLELSVKLDQYATTNTYTVQFEKDYPFEMNLSTCQQWQG